MKRCEFSATDLLSNWVRNMYSRKNANDKWWKMHTKVMLPRYLIRALILAEILRSDFNERTPLRINTDNLTIEFDETMIHSRQESNALTNEA